MLVELGVADVLVCAVHHDLGARLAIMEKDLAGWHLFIAFAYMFSCSHSVGI